MKTRDLAPIFLHRVEKPTKSLLNPEIRIFFLKRIHFKNNTFHVCRHHSIFTDMDKEKDIWDELESGPSLSSPTFSMESTETTVS